MKKIVIDARNLRTSTGRYVRELLIGLENIDNKNHYVILASKEDMDGNHAHSWKPTKNNFTLYECNIPHYSFAEQTQLLKVLNLMKPDLVHFWMPQQPLNYKGKKIATVHDLNYVHLHIHTNGVLKYEFKRQIFMRLLKKIAKTNQAIITPTKYTKDDLIQFTNIGQNKVHAIHEGVAVLSKTANPVKRFKNVDFLLYVGQSSKYKGQLNLIKSLQTLQNDHPKLRLALVGKPNSYTEKLQKYVAKNAVKNVDFLGFVDDSELAWLYKNTACYVQPSTNEGFGLMNLEAMQYGAPVASSNATCLPEVSGDAAHYFDPTDVDDMARAIGEVISNPKLRKELIAKGNKQHKKYSWARMAKETLAVYEEVLKN